MGHSRSSGHRAYCGTFSGRLPASRPVQRLGDTTPSGHAQPFWGGPERSSGGPGANLAAEAVPAGCGASGGWTGDRETGRSAGLCSGAEARGHGASRRGPGARRWSGTGRAGPCLVPQHLPIPAPGTDCPKARLVPPVPQETSPRPPQGRLIPQPPAQGPRWGALWPGPVHMCRVWGLASGPCPLSDSSRPGSPVTQKAPLEGHVSRMV